MLGSSEDNRAVGPLTRALEDDSALPDHSLDDLAERAHRVLKQRRDGVE